LALASGKTLKVLTLMLEERLAPILAPTWEEMLAPISGQAREKM
jgi:hypothetical protein